MRGDQKAGTLAGSLPRAISPSGVLTYVAFVRLLLKTALRTRDGSFRPLALLPFFCEIGLLRFRSGQQLPMPKGRTRKNSKLKNETTSLRRTDRWSVNLSTTQFLLPGLPALISVCRTLRGFVGFLKLAHKAPRGRSWSYRYGRSYRSVKK